MNKTTAPGSSGGQFVDDNPGGGVVGTLIIAADQNAHQDEVYNAIVGLGGTPSAGDLAQLYKYIVKGIKEKGAEVLDIIASAGNAKAPVAFNGATPDTYFPRLCLTNIDSYVDVSATNWPDMVPALRDVKMIFKEGLAGEISAPVVTNWAIDSNVATLTFTNNADHITFLSALAEDQTVHGSFTNWRTITLASAIGPITAGTYAITAISPSARTVSFAYTAANGGAAGSWTVEFYTHRIAGSTTTARVWTARGLALHGANDANGYFVSGALRKNDQMQGHWHNGIRTTLSGAGGGSAGILNSTDNFKGLGMVSDPYPDGINGTPRTGKITHSPALTVHLYIHGGRYVA